MKGVLFTVFLDGVEAEHGALFLEALLADLELPSGGAYTAVGTYDVGEFVQVVGAYAGATHRDLPMVLREFGRHLFAALAERYADVVAGYAGPSEVLFAIEHLIHPMVRRFYPDAVLPTFDVRPTDQGVRLVYRSHRPLPDLAYGLVEGCLAHFGCEGFVRMDLEDGGARFDVVMPVACAQEEP
ncbi:MAG: heme NO-binding domain-containing protein [Planctomycetota bacterium]